MESFLENPFLNLSLHPKYKLSYAAEDATADFVLSALCDVINENCSRMEVLEIGTGTGGLTRRLMPKILWNLKSFTASDISVVTVPEEVSSQSTFRQLHWDANLDFPRDAATDRFDLIVGRDSFHTLASMDGVLGKVHDLLVDDGFVLVEETIHHSPLFTFG